MSDMVKRASEKISEIINEADKISDEQLSKKLDELSKICNTPPEEYFLWTCRELSEIVTKRLPNRYNDLCDNLGNIVI